MSWFFSFDAVSCLILQENENKLKELLIRQEAVEIVDKRCYGRAIALILNEYYLPEVRKMRGVLAAIASLILLPFAIIIHVAKSLPEKLEQS